MSEVHLPTGTRYYVQTRVRNALLRHSASGHHIWHQWSRTWEPTMYILDYWCKGDMDTEDLTEEEARPGWPVAF